MPISLGTNLMQYVESSRSTTSQSSTFPDGLLTYAAMSNGLLPGSLSDSSHWLPTYVVSTALRSRVIFSVRRPEPEPPTFTVNGEPGTCLSANLTFIKYVPGSVGL